MLSIFIQKAFRYSSDGQQYKTLRERKIDKMPSGTSFFPGKLTKPRLKLKQYYFSM